MATRMSLNGDDEALLATAHTDDSDGRRWHCSALWRRAWRLLFPPRTRMSTRQRLTLSPWQKWRRFGRFPLKFLLHVLVLALLALEIHLVAAQFTPYTRSCEATFSNVFGSAQRDMFAINDTVAAIEAAAGNVFAFPHNSVNEWHFYKGEPVAYFHVWRNLVDEYVPSENHFNFSHPLIVHDVFDLRPDAAGRVIVRPFAERANDSVALRDYIYSMEDASLKFAYVNVAVGVLGTMPVVWNVSVDYDLSSDGGAVSTSIDALETVLNRAELPRGTSFRTLDPFIYINVAIVNLVLLNALLHVRELRRGLRLYRLTRHEFPKGVMLPQQSEQIGKGGGGGGGGGESGDASRVAHKHSYTSWESVPFDVKIQFFNLWAVVALVGSVFVIFSCVFGILSAVGTGGTINLYYHACLGTGTFIYSFTLMRYLEFSPKLLALALTVKIAMSRVTWMVLSVLPIFLAYMLFGVVTFSRYSTRFATTDDAAVSLFALLNGDDIHATFNELENNYPWVWVSRIYIYTFVAFFICVVLNTFIFIIEDAFVAAKRWVWTDPHRVDVRRPFDICELFDIIEKRKRSSRANLQNYYRRRVKSTRAPIENAALDMPTFGAGVAQRASLDDNDILAAQMRSDSIPIDVEAQQQQQQQQAQLPASAPLRDNVIRMRAQGDAASVSPLASGDVAGSAYSAAGTPTRRIAASGVLDLDAIMHNDRAYDDERRSSSIAVNELRDKVDSLERMLAHMASQQQRLLDKLERQSKRK